MPDEFVGVVCLPLLVIATAAQLTLSRNLLFRRLPGHLLVVPTVVIALRVLQRLRTLRLIIALLFDIYGALALAPHAL